MIAVLNFRACCGRGKDHDSILLAYLPQLLPRIRAARQEQTASHPLLPQFFSTLLLLVPHILKANNYGDRIDMGGKNLMSKRAATHAPQGTAQHICSGTRGQPLTPEPICTLPRLSNPGLLGSPASTGATINREQWGRAQSVTFGEGGSVGAPSAAVHPSLIPKGGLYGCTFSPGHEKR